MFRLDTRPDTDPHSTLPSPPTRSSPPAPSSKVEAEGGVGGEGPAWDPELGVLTSGNGHINRLDRDGEVRLPRRAGTNGLLFDREGRLVCCEPVQRRVTRIDRDGKLTVLTDRFDGKQYNQPNDLTIDSKGRIYFSDPRYGDRDDMEITRRRRATPIEGVYRIDPDGKVTPRHRPRGRAGQRRAGVGRRQVPVRRGQQQRHGRRRPQAVAVRPEGRTARSIRRARSCCTTGARAAARTGVKQDAKGRLYVAGGLNKPNPPAEPADGREGRHLRLRPGDGEAARRSCRCRPTR